MFVNISPADYNTDETVTSLTWVVISKSEFSSIFLNYLPPLPWENGWAVGDERGLVEKKERPSTFLSRIPLVADPDRRPPAFSDDCHHWPRAWNRLVLLLTYVLLYLYRYASRVKLITNDAQKNSENKEINRLKAVSSWLSLALLRLKCSLW